MHQMGSDCQLPYGCVNLQGSSKHASGAKPKVPSGLFRILCQNYVNSVPMLPSMPGITASTAAVCNPPEYCLEVVDIWSVCVQSI